MDISDTISSVFHSPPGRNRQSHIAFTLLEILVCLSLFAIVIGIILRVFPSIGRQEKVLERQLQFSNASQIVLENMKNDLRSVKELTVLPDILSLKCITGVSNDGDELTVPIIYRLYNHGIEEVRDSGKQLHAFVSGAGVTSGERFQGSFRLSSVEHNDRQMTGQVEIALQLLSQSGSAQPELIASLALMVTARRLATFSAPGNGREP